MNYTIAILNYTFILNHTNTLRIQHNAPPVKISEQLNTVATLWSVYMAGTGDFRHSPALYGENLARVNADIKNPTNAAISAINLFYNEKSKFNVSNWYSAGHFSQLVWKNSKYIGISVVQDAKNRAWVSMEFDPPGNYKNGFLANVSP